MGDRSEQHARMRIHPDAPCKECGTAYLYNYFGRRRHNTSYGRKNVAATGYCSKKCENRKEREAEERARVREYRRHLEAQRNAPRPIPDPPSRCIRNGSDTPPPGNIRDGVWTDEEYIEGICRGDIRARRLG